MLNENTPTSQEPKNNIIGPLHATKLAFKVVPFDDESVSSWIVRTLRANLVNSVSFIREKLEIELGSVDLDFDTPREIVDFFSSCTDLRQDEIAKLAPMLPDAIKEDNSIFSRTFWKTNKWTQGRDTDGARFCPLCLASDPIPYFRRNWRLALNIICEKHRCLLENKCPSCNTIILPNFVSWNQPITTCYSCGQDITKAEPIIISDDFTDFLTFAYGAEKPDINHYKRVNDIAWFIVRYCDTTDPAYKMSDVNKNNKFLKTLKEYENSATKIGALQQPIILYNIITIVLRFLNDDTLFEAFLKEHDSNLDIFFSEKPFICKQCGLRAVQRKTLVDHARVHTGEKPFKCEVCGMEFSFRVGLKSHLKTHTGEKPFKCSACDMHFARKDALDRHFQYNHSDDRPLKCDQCGKAFKLQIDLEKHQKRHTGKKDVQCPHCEKMFYDTGDLTKHLITHSENRPHVCDVCGDAFKTAPRLKKHKLIHSGEKPFTCENCGASFIQKEGYQAHLLNHEGRRPYKCDLCEMSFTRKGALRVHKRTHLEIKPFKCPQCEMTFVSKPHLTMHLRTHTGEKPFTCEHCGRAFAKKEYVTRHLLTHTGEKKFPCPHCEKLFAIKSSLDSHIQKIHLTLKPFICEHCGKALKTEELFQRHLRTHTGEKPFVCEHCGKGFNVESNYSDHVQTHEKPIIWENVVEPKPNESLLSWIIRLIRGNKKNPPSVMRQDLNFELNNADPEFHEKASTIIKYFSQHSGIPEVALESLITRPPEALHLNEDDLGKFSPINNILCKVGNPGHPKVSHGSRFCPICLANDTEPYFRREWRLGMVGACLEHSCLLVDQCPSCGKPLIQWNLRWDEPLTTCSHCSFDLRKSEPIQLDVDDRNILLLKSLLIGNPPPVVDVHRLFKIMTFIIANVDYTDPIFQGHPIIKQSRLIKTWIESSAKGPARYQLLAEPALMFLVLGAAHHLHDNPAELNMFLDRYYSTSEIFSTDKPFTCKVCGLRTTGMHHIVEHMRIHTGEKPHKCPHCGESFAHKSTLVKHIRTHTGEKPYVCNTCGRAFTQSGMLKSHQMTHTGEKPFKCESCGSSFARKRALASHSLTHTGEKPFTCEHCGNKFSSKKSLVNHVRTHTGEKPYQCPYCDKAFVQKGQLDVHLRLHTGEKPFTCEICGKAFRHQNTLVEHEMIHTGEKPFNCDVCKASFITKKALRVHTRIHTGEKPYVCTQCGAKFVQSGGLKRHQLTHTGEKPYSCATCGARFRDNSALTVHNRIHTGERPYKCTTCGKDFVTSSSLNVHLKTHSNDSRAE